MDLNIATGLATNIGTLMAPLTEQGKSPMYNSLVNSLATLNAFSPEAAWQLLQSFSTLQETSLLQTIERGSRESMLSSIRNLMSISKIFSDAGVSLEKFVEDSYVYLLSKNLEFGNIGNATNNIDQNYEYIQNLYDMVLSTTLNGENPVNYITSTLSATLERATGSKVSSNQNLNVTNSCYISYSISEINSSKEVFKIAECSQINPYRNINSKSSILSLTFKTNESHEIKIKNLTQPVALNVPTNAKLYKRLKVKLELGQLWKKSLQGIQPPQFGGWKSSALFIVINVLEATGEGNLLLHFSNHKMPVSKDSSTIYKSISRNSGLVTESIFIAGRYTVVVFISM